VAGVLVYETAIFPEWIDYNGHLRDAYYTLIVSLACDALMDRLGMDAAYRERTSCTLYTLEMHVHYLHEVKATDTALVRVRIVGADHKRIHADFEMMRAGSADAAATAEVMLLHVRQERDTAASWPFPPEVATALARLAAETAGMPSAGPGSRRIELRGAPRPS
jgi:acyl-CoA thioester hydrolase